MVAFPRVGCYAARGSSGCRDEFDDVDREPAGHAGRPGEEAFHRVGQPPGGAGRGHDGQWLGAAGELPVEDQEREAAEVVAVQVGDEHGGDLAGI